MKTYSELDEFCDAVGSLTKTAGRERISRNKLKKQLEKAKADYFKLKKENDALSLDDRKFRQRLDKSQKDTSEARARYIKLNNALSGSELADAQEVNFYDGSDDVGYVISGREYHIDLSGGGGALALIPWRDYKRSLKQTIDSVDSENKPESDGSVDAEAADETVEMDIIDSDEELEPLTEDDKNELDSFFGSLWK